MRDMKNESVTQRASSCCQAEVREKEEEEKKNFIFCVLAHR
jgi:hypothetical protein